MSEQDEWRKKIDRAYAATLLEKEIEKKLKDGIKKRMPRALCLKMVCIGYTGVPDRIILCPGGVMAFVELKKYRKVERVRQTYVQDLIEQLGFAVYRHVDSPERVALLIDDLTRRSQEATAK